MADITSRKLKEVQPAFLTAGDGTATLEELQSTDDAGLKNHIIDGKNNDTGVTLSKLGTTGQYATFQVGGIPRGSLDNSLSKSFPLVVRNAWVDGTTSQYGTEFVTNTGTTYRRLVMITPNVNSTDRIPLLLTQFSWEGSKSVFWTNAVEYKNSSTKDVEHLISAQNRTASKSATLKLFSSTGDTSYPQRGISISQNASETYNRIAIGGDYDATKDQTIQLHGDIYCGGVVSDVRQVIHVDATAGGGGDGTSSTPYNTLDLALAKVDGSHDKNITILVYGKDPTGVQNYSDNAYTVGNTYKFYNCNLNIVGVKEDGNSFENGGSAPNLVEHDYPRISFDMTNGSASQPLTSHGIRLSNSSIVFKNLRLITPVYTGDALSGTENLGGYGLVKSQTSIDNYDNYTEGTFNKVHIFNSRIELGDCPLVNTKVGEKTDLLLNAVRIIRTNASITYGGVGVQTNKQDSSGTAQVPTWDGAKFVNQQINTIEVGYLAKISQGSFFFRGEGALDSQSAGYFGAYPSTDSASYSYTAPTTNDRIEKEYNLISGIDTAYVVTAGVVGQSPVNINSNKVGGWYV